MAQIESLGKSEIPFPQYEAHGNVLNASQIDLGLAQGGLDSLKPSENVVQEKKKRGRKKGKGRELLDLIESQPASLRKVQSMPFQPEWGAQDRNSKASLSYNK